MQPTEKRLKILIIDDKLIELRQQIIIPLEELGYEVVKCAQPQDGLKLICHAYYLVFVDFAFENSFSYNGASLGMEIRKKCPLVPMVLLTAHGEKQIREFIYVGFDDYIDKNIAGEDEAEMMERLSDSIKQAQINAQKRIPTHFTPKELERAETRLNAMEDAYTQLAKNRSDKRIAEKVYEYEVEHGEIYKSPGLSSQALLGYFRLANAGVINPNALKAIQLLRTHGSRWEKVRENFVPIQNLIKEFEL